jgi:hypothetical protein
MLITPLSFDAFPDGASKSHQMGTPLKLTWENIEEYKPNSLLELHLIKKFASHRAHGIACTS